MLDGEEPHLFAVDTASTSLFADVPLPEIAAIADKPPGSPNEFMRKLAAGPVLVACDCDNKPVGFVAMQRVDDDVYIWLLSVHPQHARRGLGTGLVNAALAKARSMGATRCVLSTFRDVAFNAAPFYRQLGFGELPLKHGVNRAGQAFRR